MEISFVSTLSTWKIKECCVARFSCFSSQKKSAAQISSNQYNAVWHPAVQKKHSAEFFCEVFFFCTSVFLFSMRVPSLNNYQIGIRNTNIYLISKKYDFFAALYYSAQKIIYLEFIYKVLPAYEF